MTKKISSKKTKKAPRRKTKKRAPSGVPLWKQPVIIGAIVAVAAFVMVVLYGKLPAPNVSHSPDAARPVVALDDLQVEVDSLFWQLGIDATAVSQQPSEGVIDLFVQAPFPENQTINGFEQRLKGLSKELRVESYPPRKELRVFTGPALTVHLHFLTPVQERDDNGPMVVVIMDDIGRSLDKVRSLLSLEQPVTLAILPSTPHAYEAAQLAYDRGREIMVHIPMEPQGYPAIEPGSDALLLEHSDWEVTRRLSDMFQRVPHAVGGNNHMGSRYTEYGEGMKTVAAFMRDQGYFFVDSRTTGKTIAEQTMRDFGVPVLARDVFLDNNQDVDLIRAEIRHLAARAKRDGQAVGICHPHAQTLEALAIELPELEKQGIRFMTVTGLLRQAQLRGN